MSRVVVLLTTLALAMGFRRRFHSFALASEAYVLLIAMIAFHELVGPPLFRLGPARCGEIRA